MNQQTAPPEVKDEWRKALDEKNNIDDKLKSITKEK